MELIKTTVEGKIRTLKAGWKLDKNSMLVYDDKHQDVHNHNHNFDEAKKALGGIIDD